MNKALSPLLFVTGLLMGSGLALMMAPHSGRVTRSKMKSKLEESKEGIEEKALDMKKSLSERRRLAHEAIDRLGMS